MAALLANRVTPQQLRDTLVLDTPTSLVRNLPHGALALDGLESYVRQVLTRGGRTNDSRRLQRPLLVPATAPDTGEIHVLGEQRNERTPISKAVAPSAAIPPLFAPVGSSTTSQPHLQRRGWRQTGEAGEQGCGLG